MRRRLALLVLTLALAGPAGAQTPLAQAAASPTLRGAQSVETTAAEPSGAAEAARAALAQSTIPLRLLPDTPVAGAAGRCRLSCAQSYYFCLSGDGGDDCPATWGQCRAACEAPSVAGLAGG